MLQKTMSFAYAIAFLLLVAPIVSAQSSNATLSGVVVDVSGAVVANAEVTATQIVTGLARHATTSGSGTYSIPSLPIGDYSVTVTSTGFKRIVIPSITLQVDQAAALNPVLQPGAATQEVTVSTVLPLINSQSSSIGQVVENRSIESLALNGRQFWQLTALTPGASYTPGGQQIARGGAGVRSSSVNVTINGSSSTFTGWLLDGADITDFEAGGTNIQVNVDALDEFKVLSATMPAEYGHTPALVSATLKSGTNQFHGTVFEFLRNDYFDARNYFTVGRKNALRRNQFGGTVGGPIWKNKLFLFTDIERTIQTADNVFSDIVPSDAMRNTTTGAVFPKAITDPTTGKPFPGNTIPVNRISSQAKYFLQFMPTQSQGAFTAPQTLNIYKGDIKIDAALTSQDHLASHYSINNNQELDPNQFPALGKQPLYARAQSFGIAETHILSSRWLNEARAGYYRDIINFSAVLPGTNFIQNAGINGYQQSQINPSFPYITLSGYSAFNGSGLNNLPKIIFVRTWQYGDSVSYTSGKHEVKFGGQLYHRKDAFIIGQSQEGTFGFTTKYTGDAFGDFLLGLPASALRSYPLSDYGVYANLWAAFVEDDYHVARDLTLNLGLRYEHNPYFNAINGQMAAFDSSTGKVIVPMHNGALLVPAAQAVVPIALPLYSDRLEGTDALHLPDSIRRTGPGQLAPRLGFAWRPGNSDRLVVRGAYGLFAVFLDTNLAINWTKAPPFLISQTASNGLTGTTPTYNWSDPFLGQSIIAPNTTGQPCPGTTLVLLTCVTPSLYTAPPVLQHTYVQQYNLVLQTQLTKNLSLEVAYLGNHTTHAQDNGVLSNIPNPGAGAIQTRRPFAQFGQFNLTLTNGAANYNSLQTKLEKRFSGGFQALVSYTYSKSLDNIWTGIRPDPGYLSSYAVSDFNLTNVLAVSSVYELPFGKGRRFLGGANRPVDALIGGWETAVIFTDRTGLPYTPSISSDLANTGVTTEVPNRIGSGAVPHPTAARWFDPTAFALPTQYTYGNSGRNILLADGLVDVDATLKKNFRFTESRGLELRLEAFNLANHPTFAAPNSTIGSSSAGTISSTLNANRTLQAAAKIYF